MDGSDIRPHPARKGEVTELPPTRRTCKRPASFFWNAAQTLMHIKEFPAPRDYIEIVQKRISMSSGTTGKGYPHPAPYSRRIAPVVGGRIQPAWPRRGCPGPPM